MIRQEGREERKKGGRKGRRGEERKEGRKVEEKGKRDRLVEGWKKIRPGNPPSLSIE
jgi:hypothetical protein